MGGPALSPDMVERFALEYVKDLNATQAYLRIRPDTKPNSARTLGAKMLAKIDVQEAVQRFQAAETDRLKIDAAKVLQELAICGFSDIRHYLKSDTGHLEVAPGVDDLAGRAVSSVKHKRTVRGSGDKEYVEETSELKLWDKPGTLKTLAKHLGLIDQDAGAGSLTVTWRYREE